MLSTASHVEQYTTYVEEPHVPCPHRLPADMAALVELKRQEGKTELFTHLIAAVSSVTPSPLAPKSWSSRNSQVRSEFF